MTKLEFLEELRVRLAGLTQKDIDASIDYYSEMIDDRIEDGMSEDEAVAAVGTPKEAAEQVLNEIPLKELIKNRMRPTRTLRVWEIVLLILGAPIWLSLLAGALVVAVSLYAVLWSVIAVFHAASITIGACALVGIFYPIYYFILGKVGAALFVLGAGIFLAGLTFFAFYGSFHATKATCRLTKWLFLKIKSCFVRKGKKQ